MDLRRFRLLAGFLFVLLPVACGGVPGGSPAPGGSPDAISGPLSVFAAASLTDAFKEVGGAFQKQNPSVSVQFNFAGSQALATQLNQGAPGDVFASADLPNLQKVVDAGGVATVPRVFATNQLQIVVGAGNPRGIRGLADLAAQGTVVVLCAPSVPCGAYDAQAMGKAGVRVSPRSQEQDVKAVVTKVSLGEADAGIAYVTDVRAAGPKVQGVDIPTDQNVLASYPIATLKGATNPRGAAAFVDFVLGPRGQAILGGYGFGKP